MTLDLCLSATGPIPLDVAFQVGEGQLLALVGHSGSGKTTILRSIAGLWTPSRARVSVGGTVWVDTEAGLTLAPHRRRVGVVFQNYALFPHMTALQNVMAAMDRADRAEALHLLDLVNLGALAARKPAQLSGGQQQRVAIARALAREPQVLLLDEPFSAIDRVMRDQVQAELMALRAHLRMPIVLVTHDVGEAQMLADHVVLIEKGRVLSAGPTAQVMADPRAVQVLGVRELSVVVTGRVAEHLPDGLTRLDAQIGPLWVPTVDASLGADLRLRIMAQDVLLARTRPEGLAALNMLAGHVAQIVPGLGPGVLVYLALGEGMVLARLPRRLVDQLDLRPGAQVHVVLRNIAVARGPVPRGSIAKV
ncbi:MAG: molybdenum ABC transporter ATP-binding protein [Roseinatronobacter sp.]